MSSFHTPVMTKEVTGYLAVKKDNWYIDCNLGSGGHTDAILKLGGKVLGIDVDPDAINYVAKNNYLQISSGNLILYQDNFSKIKEIVSKFKLHMVYGVLFDLGVSTHQLETPQRGFSFNLDAPLDMRMDPNIKVSAADLVNGLLEKELAGLFWKFGEERFSRQIAKKITEYRQTKKIETTNELAQIILHVRSTRGDRTHPATRVFQALRIVVNDELNSLRKALPQALDILEPGGRLVVISFHSLEDRIVKNFFKDEQKKGSIKIITQKPVTPTKEEINANPRSRSGKLRAAEKITYCK